MRLLRILVIVGVTLALVAGPASAAPAGRAISSVSGTGWRLSPDAVPRVEFRVDAWISPTGEIQGSYAYANPFVPLTLSGPVTCMDVEGNTAVIGGIITAGGFLGEEYLVFFIDNGEPVFGEHGPDQVTQTYVDVSVPDGFPATCPPAHENPFDPDPRLDIIGEIAVNDGL